MYLWNYRSLLSYSFIFYLILTHHMSLKCVKVEVGPERLGPLHVKVNKKKISQQELNF